MSMSKSKSNALNIFADEEEHDDTEKIEFITSIGEVEAEKVSTRTEKGKLVIPLKLKKTAEEVNEHGPDEKDMFEEEKAEEEQNEQNLKAKKMMMTWGLNVPVKRTTNTTTTTTTTTKTISVEKPVPILIQNRIPGMERCRNDSERFSLDLNLRPDEPTSDSYSNVPVSEFGAALLRGMGWKGEEESDSQGKKVKPIQYVPRPERLGLGASETSDPSNIKVRKPVEQSLGIEMTRQEEKDYNGPKRKIIKNHLEIELLERHANYVSLDEKIPKKLKLNVEIGSKVEIIDGPHRNLLGIVKNSSKDEKCWLVELRVNQEIVAVSKSFVKIFDSSSASASVSVSVSVSDSKETTKSDEIWTVSGLKVKIISKNSFLQGKYYNRKGFILDVRSKQDCTVKLYSSSASTSTRSNEETIVHDVPQSALETIVPRTANPNKATVVYLKNDKGPEFLHSKFRILQLDDSKSSAVIQSEDDLSFIFEADYNDICEFIDLI